MEETTLNSNLDSLLEKLQLLNKRAEIEKSLSDYNMLINANTLNFSCTDIGKFKEYLT